MTDKNDGGPAFPRNSETWFDGEKGGVGESQDGMTLRDYFAAKAMQGLISGGYTDSEFLATKSGEIADAMLKERDK